MIIKFEFSDIDYVGIEKRNVEIDQLLRKLCSKLIKIINCAIKYLIKNFLIIRFEFSDIDYMYIEKRKI